MIDTLANKARERMEDTLKSLSRDMDSISTGRANPVLLDSIRVDIYGSFMPIDQLASISVAESSTLSIQAWDKGSVKPIEKAIMNSNLGFNPMVDGQIIRISIPKLSEERRRELSKYGEDKKIAVRNIRRDVLDDFKKDEQSSSKDQLHAFTDIVQKVTDEFISKIDNIVDSKEKDLMKI